MMIYQELLGIKKECTHIARNLSEPKHTLYPSLDSTPKLELGPPHPLNQFSVASKEAPLL